MSVAKWWWGFFDLLRCAKGAEKDDKTPLSKSYLKLEQLAAKITASVAAFNDHMRSS